MKIDIIYSYYNSKPEQLEAYLHHWSNNFPDTKHDINFVIVDDHSSNKAIETISNSNIKCNLQVYYIEDDIIWNEMGARNLGAEQTTSDIILFLDWDHFICENLIKDILCIDLSKNLFILRQLQYICNNFSKEVVIELAKLMKLPIKRRLVEDGDSVFAYNLSTPGQFRENLRMNKTINEVYASKVPCTATGFCLTRELWNQIGPFDEDFAGAYGGYDLAFIDHVKNSGINVCTWQKDMNGYMNPAIQLTAGKAKAKRHRPNKNTELLHKRGIVKINRKWKATSKEIYNPRPGLRFKWIKQYENIL